MTRAIRTFLVVFALLLASWQDSTAQQFGVAEPPKQFPRPPAYQPLPAQPTPPRATEPPRSDPAVLVSGSPDESKNLGPGDTVAFQIVEDRDPPIVKRITDTGDLDVPYIGRVRVSGRTCAAAANEIKRRLEQEFYYTATVKLAIDQINPATAAGRVYVSGLVRVPGPQFLVPGEKLTVSAAVLKAGGFAQFAETRKVKVSRKNGNSTQSFEVDLKAVLEKGELHKDAEILDGDYIFVPQRLINW